MELLLGSHVREHGNRIGRLAGVELDPASRIVLRILVSPDGELGPLATGYMLPAIALVHDDGEIELRVEADADPLPPARDVALLSRATRLRRGTHYTGRLTGVEVEPGTRGLVSVMCRQHWWSRRFDVPAEGLDFSKPGEISTGSRAA